MQKDYFGDKSKVYEADAKRVDNVKNIATAIKKYANLKKNGVFLDFGSGTGLLTEYISKEAKKIIANDISESMNQKLIEKIEKNKFGCNIKIVSDDISEGNNNIELVDGIISSMTIHHIQDINLLMKTFFDMLKKGGVIALADLESENGTFHKEDTGVFHFGFDKSEFLNYAKDAGFTDLKIETVSVAEKPYGSYPIFLLTGKKS